MSKPSERSAGLATLPPKPTAQPPKGGQVAAQAPQATPDPEAFIKTPVEAPSAPSTVAAPIEAEEPTQRLTLEIPLSLHILIKTGTVQRRTKIKDEVLALLESHYRPK